MLCLRRGVDDEKAKICGDEFIAAAAGVEFPAEGAEFLYEGFFDEVVDVFGGGTEGLDPGGIGFRAFRYFIECGERLPDFRRGEDADGFESFGPSAVYGNFVGKEALVEREG